jgi:hypothetical protein
MLIVFLLLLIISTITQHQLITRMNALFYFLIRCNTIKYLMAYGQG